MGIASFILGILVSLITCTLMIPTILPLLGWVAWIPVVITLPVALLGIIFACVAIFKKGGRGKFWAWTGLILNVVSFIIPVIRLIIGGGFV
jgi:hypothetical protein